MSFSTRFVWVACFPLHLIVGCISHDPIVGYLPPPPNCVDLDGFVSFLDGVHCRYFYNRISLLAGLGYLFGFIYLVLPVWSFPVLLSILDRLLFFEQVWDWEWIWERILGTEYWESNGDSQGYQFGCLYQVN